jgi:hypothetical protein
MIQPQQTRPTYRSFVILALIALLATAYFRAFGLDARSLQRAQAAPLQQAGACQQLLVNGDLESSGGWQFGPTPAPGAIVSSPVHAGSFAIRLGITSGTNRVAYSTAYQAVTLPADAQQILLTYWERPGATGDSGDYREVIALRPNLTILRLLERQNGAGNDQWTQRTFDLSDLRGQSILIYFNVYNNGSGALLSNHLDDISLQRCDTSVTATPTATATPTETPTPTATATIVVTPTTATPTATVPPSGVMVRVEDRTLPQGQTSFQASLDLLGATAAQKVGVISVDVQYDATVLSATGCTVSDQFDLLLCNLASPGIIQLAGVAATGIVSDLQVADLRFDIAQPANLNTQLTVQLDTVADTEGLDVAAIAQHGQVTAACEPGSEGCPITIPLYLPLVQR